MGDLGSELAGERGTSGEGVSGRHNGEGGGPPALRRRPPPALFFSLLVREALLPEPLSGGDTRPGAGWGGRPLRSPPRVLAPDPGWVGVQASAATLGLHGGWAPGAGFDGVWEGEKG